MVKRQIFKGTVKELIQIAKSHGMFELEEFDTIEEVIERIQVCEGKHKQQIPYSSYHNSLTQICFDCQKIRTNLKSTISTGRKE